MRERGKRYIDPEKKFCVHPDMLDAFQNYNGTDDSFKKVFRERDEKTRSGELFWNPDHDVEMRETAIERSKQHDFDFPRRRKKCI